MAMSRLKLDSALQIIDYTMLSENYSKQVRRWIQKVRLPSATCQACLSQKSAERDYILTCQLCQSSIHSKHYGREIEDPKEQQLDKWYCQRCRMICQLAEQRKESEIQAMQCHFCPSVKGIVKRVVFNAAETIWLHPECYTWPYPIVYQKNSRRIHFNSEYPSRATGKFWVNFEHQKEALCQICNDSRGLKIKCMYYTCEKYYHCSCAKTIGVIRDLQSMRFDNCETYIPPYCQEHLEKRIADCALKARKYKGLKDEVKASHFSQMAASYAVQHKNLLNSARKYEQQQKIRKQMEYQVGQNEDIMEDLSFEEDASRAKSHHPPEFYQFVFDAEYPKRLQPTRRASILQAHPSRMELEPPVSPQGNAEQQPEINATINFLKTFSQNRAGKYERDSEPEESEWHSSPDFDEEDD